ncbi:MAG: universal stress protein [Bacteroidales bacterium]|nr:universal stress protein [Bacteroidales bacterium]
MKTTIKPKVLIALDYDPTAQKVANAGYALAKSMNADVTLLHVMSDPVYFSSVENVPITGMTDSLGVDPLVFDADDRLKEVSQHFLDTIKHHLRDNSIETELEEGDFADTILMKAKGLGTDILVMGSHSHRWLENIVMGSVTTKVLRLTSIPLFIVPTKNHD